MRKENLGERGKGGWKVLLRERENLLTLFHLSAAQYCSMMHRTEGVGF
jgi:hypothetical protein